jgi:uncharacterized protein YqjF (DUF2071 family)
MLHRWDHLTFLHWRYDPAVVQQLLPPGLTVETFDGAAWVGLVPFVMQVRAPGVAPVPWLSDFPETNVRTYAVGPDGSTGVWFLSLDATRLPAVLGGRTGYRMPYHWSRMRVRRSGDRIAYDCDRRWPRPTPAASRIEVTIGDRFRPDELGDLDHWLTARWSLFSYRPSAISVAFAEHPPWVLHRAEATRVDDRLVRASGLPAPQGEPLVHHSLGTEVRISPPARLR